MIAQAVYTVASKTVREVAKTIAIAAAMALATKGAEKVAELGIRRLEKWLEDRDKERTKTNADAEKKSAELNKGVNPTK
jgi:hypothetical protein